MIRDDNSPLVTLDRPAGFSDAGRDSSWAQFSPRAGALRWVGGIYLLLLGLALLILPPAPLSSPVDSELRGAVTVLGGLALLWLAGLAPNERITLVVSASVALPQLWFAGEFLRQGIVPGAATLGLLAVAILLTGALPPPRDGASSRADALGLAFGTAQAVQGLSYLLWPPSADPIPAAVGLSSAACAALLIAGGVGVVLAQLLPQLPVTVYRAAHLFAGSVTLVMWAAVGLRFDTAYLYLGAATLVRGASVAALPWLSGRLQRFDGRALGPRLALALGTVGLAPLLVALPLVLDATAGRAGQVEVRQAVFGGALLLLAAAGLAAWWLSARLTTPLAVLVRAVEDVAAGQPAVVPATAITELDRLGKAVATMAATIATREAALEDRRREFETLVEHAPDIVARFDRDLRHRYVNAAIEAATGIRAGAFLGKTNADLGMPSDIVALWDHHAQAAFATGEEQHYEFAFPSPDGPRHFRARLVPEMTASGTADTLLAVVYDVTARVRAETERATLLDALAHDLKNPLGAIKTQAQLLQRQLRRGTAPDPAVQADRLADIDRQVERIVALLDDLRADAVTIVPERRAVDLVALARECAETAQRAYPGHALRIEANGTNLTGSWDPDQLGRVVANLLDNALKYSPAGTTVTAELTRVAGTAMLTVRDEGIGIPAVDLPHVFAFRRRASNVGTIDGSGIGLASCKRIVEAHGGTIGVASVEGRGTTVTVRLPLT